MDNFSFYSPTYFVFGKDEENSTGAYVKRFGGKKILIHYGGGSVIKGETFERDNSEPATTITDCNTIY